MLAKLAYLSTHFMDILTFSKLQTILILLATSALIIELDFSFIEVNIALWLRNCINWCSAKKIEICFLFQTKGV